MGKTEKRFIEWEPAISPGQVFAGETGLNELQFDGTNLYWIETRPSEKGRHAIVKMGRDGKSRDVIPRGFNARTRVHEYGGGSYAVFKGMIYFTNFEDQRIYRQDENPSSISPLTPAKNSDNSLGKYASLTVSPNGRWLLFVYEKEYSAGENKNFLGVLDLTAKKISEPSILAESRDFYGDPVFSHDGEKIAWLQWNHPDMPWDATELMEGKFEGGIVKNARRADGGKGKSVCFPKYDLKGNLYYAMDSKVGDSSLFENWWNIYRYNGKSERITSLYAEFGEPHWAFGQSNYDFLSGGKIAARMLKGERDFMVIIDPETKSLSSVKSSLCHYRCIKTDKESRVFFIGAGSEEKPSIYSLDIRSGRKNLRLVKKSSNTMMNPGDISTPVPIEYLAEDGEKIHAFFYYPRNSRFSGPVGEKPPLILMGHGGPTSRADSFFSPVIQFWTSAGFAVVDVNYRGSTGYGRRYRDALLSKWGVIDTSDAADAVKYLVKTGKVSPDMVAVRGKSAGGYMVQRIMTEYPDLIKAGASYYGIGNLVTLARYTHKFESRYTDNLVGEKFSAGAKKYSERSPINHLENLRSPLIIFQGSEDKIVTPGCAREVARALEERGIKYKYVEYEGESHGFRSKKNKTDSLKKEFLFYRRVFRGKKMAGL